MTDSQHPLEIENLTKKYGTLEAVKGVSFALQPGEIFGLLGPNGAGKTSIISILNTLELPTSGGAKVFGLDVTEGQAKPFIGVVPQEIVSHGFFTVEEVLHFHSGYYGLRHNHKQIQFLLGELGLFEHRNKGVRQLSGGMKRRLLIAKALVHQPKLLILDEPTAGVDVELRNSLWKFVRKLNAEGMSVLLTTHYLEEAETLCHRVGVLHHGLLMRVGKTKDLVEQLTTRELSLQLKPGSELPSLTLPFLHSQTPEELQFRLPNRADLSQIFSKIPGDRIQGIKIREGKLEDAFLNLVEEPT